MFRHFMDLARRVGAPHPRRAARWARATACSTRSAGSLIYGPLRNSLGMSRVRVAYTAGEAIGPDLFVFYRSLGINLKQLYGSDRDLGAWCACSPTAQVKPDTVGPPMKGVEIRVLDSRRDRAALPGAVPRVLQERGGHARGEGRRGLVPHRATRATSTPDGHLKIIDRAKDVGKLSDGTLFAPKYLENKLKFFPLHQGGRGLRPRPGRSDRDGEHRRAGRRRLGGAPRHPVLGLHRPRGQAAGATSSIRECVEKVNADLAADPKLAGSQIHRFVILHKELDADDGELTRTRKVRRGFIGEKYATIVDALYSGTDDCVVEAQVRFEDGRTGAVRAELALIAAKTLRRRAGARTGRSPPRRFRRPQDRRGDPRRSTASRSPSAA